MNNSAESGWGAPTDTGRAAGIERHDFHRQPSHRCATDSRGLVHAGVRDQFCQRAITPLA